MLGKQAMSTNLTWLEKIYPGIAQKKIRDTFKDIEAKRTAAQTKPDKNTWAARMNESAIVLTIKHPTGNTSQERHGYITMDGGPVTDRVRDVHLASYMSTLQEVQQWNRCIPAITAGYLLASEETKGNTNGDRTK